MAVDHTVRLWKDIPDPGFDTISISSQAIAVQQADGELAELEGAFSREVGVGVSTAAVAVDRIHGFARKNIKH